MEFQKLPDNRGMVYVPDSNQDCRKNDCRDCFSCQWCGNERCRVCLESSLNKSLRCRDFRRERASHGLPVTTW